MGLDSIRRSGVVVLVLATASVAMVVEALGWRRYLVLGTATLALVVKAAGGRRRLGIRRSLRKKSKRTSVLSH